MKKVMTRTAIFLLFAFGICLACYSATRLSILETLSITFGVSFFHFAMRLMVGYFWDWALKNHVDYTKKWFSVGDWELRIYQLMRVKKWKKFMPTFEKNYFDIKQHSLEEIVGATCQAEVVHESIVLLSFFPVFLSIWFGSCAVFVITSIAAACVDLLFIMIQRFNRFRLLKIINRH